MSVAGWDAVIVGAGPAGSATAARLARAGHRVLLLDRDEFPRSKACGECLSPAAVTALISLGAMGAVQSAAHDDIVGWRIFAGAAEPFEGMFPSGVAGIGIRRDKLDGLLVEYARSCGATVRTGFRVTDLLRDRGQITGVRVSGKSGEKDISSRLVIGADGLRSVVVRRLGLLQHPPKLKKLALTAHMRGVFDLAGRGELHSFAWGCVGVAGVGDNEANVTVVLAPDGAKNIAGDRVAYFDAMLHGVARLSGARRTGNVLATGPFDCPTRRAVADGALLVGDAAGYFDPFTGQGIFRALRGAELVAETADAALRRDDVSCASLVGYEQARRRAFSSGVRLQHVIEAFVSRPWLFGPVAGRFRDRPSLADALVSVTGDLAPVSSLLRPRLLAQLVT